MDKFKQLEEKLKSVIKCLDEQINSKQEKIEENNVKIEEMVETVENLKVNLKYFDEKRKTLEATQNKNILLYVVRKMLNDLLQEYQDYVKNKQLFAVISIPILAIITIFLISVAIMSGGIQSILFISALISLYFVGAKLDSIIKLHRLKKRYTLEGLNGSREDIIESIDEYSNDIANFKNINAELYAEIQSLQAEQGQFILDIEKVRSAREQAINEKASEILSVAFKEFDTSNINTRIRAREKGGINNG